MKKYDLMNQINARGTYLWFFNCFYFLMMGIAKNYGNTYY